MNHYSANSASSASSAILCSFHKAVTQKLNCWPIHSKTISWQISIFFLFRSRTIRLSDYLYLHILQSQMLLAQCSFVCSYLRQALFYFLHFFVIENNDIFSKETLLVF